MANLGLACLQTLYFHFKVRRVWVIKYNCWGFIDHRRKGVVVLAHFACELAYVFENNKKKNKLSVYRLI